jgi:antitoxin component YwqK of YwqJK toxin-antitoxin module
MEQKVRLPNRKIIKIVILSSIFILLVSCGPKEEEFRTLKSPKPVPFHYKKNTDSGFSQNQDTLFFQGKRFSGRVYGLYPGGDTSFILAYWLGLQEGNQKIWYTNKKLKESRTYVSGKKEGIQEAWWPNGILQFKFLAIDDEYSGVLEQWFESGKRERIFHYLKGHEEGSEKIWWPDGKIRANYKIINGEKFGLFGQKLCINKNITKEIK